MSSQLYVILEIMKMNLVRKSLTPAGHVSFFDLTGQAGIDGDELQLSGCTET